MKIMVYYFDSDLSNVLYKFSVLIIHRLGSHLLLQRDRLRFDPFDPGLSKSANRFQTTVNYRLNPSLEIGD